MQLNAIERSAFPVGTHVFVCIFRIQTSPQAKHHKLPLLLTSLAFRTGKFLPPDYVFCFKITLYHFHPCSSTVILFILWLQKLTWLKALYNREWLSASRAKSPPERYSATCWHSVVWLVWSFNSKNEWKSEFWKSYHWYIFESKAPHQQMVNNVEKPNPNNSSHKFVYLLHWEFHPASHPTHPT